MKAIILAAGDSKRLRPYTDNLPKCLIKINEKAIIDYQIEALIENNVKRINIVVGYFAEKIMKYLTEKYPEMIFRFIYNPVYSKTNTIYSLWLASEDIDSDFLYFNADVLIDKLIIKKLINCKYENCLAICPQKCGEEEVKVVVEGNTIIDIGKQINPDLCLGEFIGIAKFSGKFNQVFVEKLDEIVKRGNVNAFFELALQELLYENKIENKLSPLNIHALPYIEIDTPEDLEKAQEEICHKLK